MIVTINSNAVVRRGSVTLFGMAFLTIALLLLIWVVFSAQTRYTKERMQIAADAAALAAAEELVDDAWISGDANDIREMLARSRVAANAYAKLNPIQGVSTPVFANESNAHDGDIVFGHFPLSGEQKFQFGPRYPAESGDPDEDLEHMDSVRIVILRNKDHDNSQLKVITTPTSPNGKMNGIAASIAVLDRYVYGFRPSGDQTVSYIPLALFSDPTATNGYSWEKRSVYDGTNDNYQFSRTDKSFSAGIDGIAEFKVRLGVRPASDTTSVTSALIRTTDVDLTGDGIVDLADMIAQIATGLRGEHLVGSTFDGRLVLDDDGLLTVLATEDYPQQLANRTTFVDSLETLRKTGRAFVFPLYRKLSGSTDAVSLSGFVAARIVAISKKRTRSDDPSEEEEDDGDETQTGTRSIVLTLQSAMISVPSAITDARREIDGDPLPPNPYIAKVRLGR